MKYYLCIRFEKDTCYITHFTHFYSTFKQGMDFCIFQNKPRLYRKKPL